MPKRQIIILLISWRYSMQELRFEQIEDVCGSGAGAVGSCVAVGGLGMKAGSGFGPWGALGGAAAGCLIGVGLYYL
jgi:hypothetical protein